MTLHLERAVDVDAVDWDEVHYVLGARLWLLPGVLTLYPAVDVVTVRRKRRLICCWALPVVDEPARGRCAVRSARLLPHTGPEMRHEHAMRSFVVHELVATELANTYACVDVPLSPSAHDLTPYTSRGFEAAWRSTYVVHCSEGVGRNLSTMARRVLTRSLRYIVLSVADAGAFAFDRGLAHLDAAQHEDRERVVRRLARDGRAVTVEAHAHGGLLGQALVATDDVSGYLLHSWHDADADVQGIDGVPAALALHAAEWTSRRPGVTTFDLEGSVLPGVARFYASLGATVLPYAQLRRSARRPDQPTRWR